MSGKNYEEKFDKLRKKFNMAEEAVEELSEDLDDLAMTETPEPGQHLPILSDNPNEVFTIDLLKQDFLLVRQNVLSVINRGQMLLEKVEILDIGDMKGSQLMALATLQKTLGDNVKLLMDIYKDIISIEKDKRATSGTVPGLPGAGGMTVKGDVHQQTIVVAGNTSDLLKAIKPQGEPVDVTPEQNDG